MKILIVDDTETNRLVLGAMLRKDGHVVFEGVNGQEGLALFEQEQPDLILMDIMMPIMDGYQATSLIKQRSTDGFVPVIFLTAVTDEAGLARCIAHGGDDFLTKPYSQVLLRAKIQALARIRELHALVKTQHDALLAARKKDEGDQEAARTIFQKILRAGCLGHPSLTCTLAPAELLSGDLMLAAMTPHGLLHVMMGDFTGHGLAAAVGAVPVAEVFYGMSRSGFGIGSIAQEINHKLHVILPTNLFCAAALLEWDPAGRRITVWNGGMPDGLVLRQNAEVIHRLHSKHLPLGLLTTERFDAGTETIEVQPGDRMYLYSDGLIEARNSTGDMFGSNRLERCLQDAFETTDIFQRVHDAVVDFCDGEAAHDDIALLQLICDPSPIFSDVRDSGRLPGSSASKNWHLELSLEAEALHRVDPLPTLMRALADVQDLGQHTRTVFTILAELVTNAIDHGLLGLDSTIKATPDGFSQYYEQRDRLLAQLRQGTLRVHLAHVRKALGGRLAITVEDSGPGFDVQSMALPLATNDTHSGRGIPLLRSLCDTLTYRGNGNSVEAVYTWS